MLVLIFSFLDFLVLLVIALTHFDVINSWRIIVACSLYLISKAFIFRGEAMSVIDAIIGVYIIFLLFGLKSFITYIVMAWFIYKIAFSLGSVAR